MRAQNSKTKKVQDNQKRYKRFRGGSKRCANLQFKRPKVKRTAAQYVGTGFQNVENGDGLVWMVWQNRLYTGRVLPLWHWAAMQWSRGEEAYFTFYIFNFISSFSESRKKKKRQTDKQEAESRYSYSQIELFSSRLAKPETALTIVHKVFNASLVWSQLFSVEISYLR